MKKLSLKLNIDGLNLSKVDSKKESTELLLEIIHVIIQGYAFVKQGFNEKERWKYHRLCDAIDDAIKGGSEEVCLDNEYVNFLLLAKKEGRFFANNLTRRVEELIQEMDKSDEVKE